MPSDLNRGPHSVRLDLYINHLICIPSQHVVHGDSWSLFSMQKDWNNIEIHCADSISAQIIQLNEYTAKASETVTVMSDTPLKQEIILQQMPCVTWTYLRMNNQNKSLQYQFQTKPALQARPE